MAMTLEQQRVLALAAARLRLQQQAGGAQPATNAPPAVQQPIDENGISLNLPIPGSEGLNPAPEPAPALRPNLSGVPFVGPALATFGYDGSQAPTSESLGSQGLSGINEGLANMVGAPVDLANTALQLGAMGVNKIAGTDFQASDKPFGGSSFIKDLIAPSIAPPTDDPMKQVVRRIGQEVGSTLIPAAGVASKVAGPAAVIGKDIALAAGSGLGAGVAQQVAPDNPIAELVGQVAGGLTVGGLMKGLNGAKKAFINGAPSIEDLQSLKSAAYKAVDNSGAQYAPQDINALALDVEKTAQNKNISPTRHPAAFSFIEDMKSRSNKPYTLTELDQLRQEVGLDLLASPSKSEQFFGKIIQRKIDNFIDKTPPSQIVAANAPYSAIPGNAAQTGDLIKTARELNQRFRKSETLDTAMTKAERRAASTGSGGNIDNAMRQNIRSILDNPKKAMGFFPDEIAMMEQIVRGTAPQNALRLVGKLSPQGNGLMAALSLGGVAANPAIAAAPISGIMAKYAADGMTQTRIKLLRALVASGKPVPKGLNLTPIDLEVIGALASGQAVNQNAETAAPLKLTVHGTATTP